MVRAVLTRPLLVVQAVQAFAVAVVAVQAVTIAQFPRLSQAVRVVDQAHTRPVAVQPSARMVQPRQRVALAQQLTARAVVAVVAVVEPRSRHRLLARLAVKAASVAVAVVAVA